MRLPRASGVLLHPTSLPGPHGIGDLGREALDFVEFLAATGQKWWQVLPVGPTGYGNSPYQSHSSFAGNRLLIDPDDLVERGWLDAAASPNGTEMPADRVDFDAAAALRDTWLPRAFERFKARKSTLHLEEFVAANRIWLEDYVFFQALKDAHGGLPWYQWEPGLVARDPAECSKWRERLSDQIRYHEFVQFVFELQWRRLRAACREKQVALIGDVPIFVAHDSADVWANQDLFYLDQNGQPTAVAGVPPDYFSETGQLWGNPLYRWGAHSAQDYAWWRNRFRFLLERVDLIRVDHFRGFEAYWEIPAGAKTAVSGRWVRGPGKRFFEAIRRQLGSLPLIAEDLGVITPPVEALRDEFELPGMRVLQFGFGADSASQKHLPHRYIPHCIAYTGTHDNDTIVGWFTSTEVATTQPWEEIQAERAYARRYVNSPAAEIHWDMIRLAFSSVADTAIIPLQDILGLGSAARMNVPGRAVGNWGWRFTSDQLDQRKADRLADVTALYSRWTGRVPPHLDPHRRRASKDPPAQHGTPEASTSQSAP
jgi:4-alpha-glucanotransferase